MRFLGYIVSANTKIGGLVRTASPETISSMNPGVSVYYYYHDHIHMLSKHVPYP